MIIGARNETQLRQNLAAIATQTDRIAGVFFIAAPIVLFTGAKSLRRGTEPAQAAGAPAQTA